jgi:hypothetical protein
MTLSPWGLLKVQLHLAASFSVLLVYSIGTLQRDFFLVLFFRVYDAVSFLLCHVCVEEQVPKPLLSPLLQCSSCCLVAEIFQIGRDYVSWKNYALYPTPMM